jgi:spermidine synthase
MTRPWIILDSVTTAEGTLELRQRGERDFLITIGGLVLMNSSAHRSEVALGELACAHLRGHPRPRVLVGGLGMGYTLRAVLDSLSESARVVVAELNPIVPEWCRGPLAGLTGGADADPRVTIQIVDVAVLIRRAASGGAEDRFDAVVLDLYTGPHAGCDGRDDPLYGSRAIATTRAALSAGGIFAVWGESYDAGFDRRLRTAGFTVTNARPGRGGLRHAVYVAKAAPGAGAKDGTWRNSR